MLRYIWVFSGYQNTNNLMSNTLDFGTKYYEQVEQIRQEKIEDRKQRLNIAHERAKARLEERKIMQQKLEEQLQKRDKDDESKQYDQKLEKLEKKHVGKGTSTATKRILAEYKHFQTKADLENFEIKFKNNDNFYVWTVVLDILKFELTEELKGDLEYVKLKQNTDPTLDFEITFPDNFPFDPPFIRVVRPIFKFHTGHVTIGGSLCMESLTPSGWSSVRSIEGLFVEILSIILQGEARLDKSRLGHTYSYAEARSAYERVARHHGWL